MKLGKASLTQVCDNGVDKGRNLKTGVFELYKPNRKPNFSSWLGVTGLPR